ncbi:carboxylesterase 1-like [Euphorbia lathyris]|uniref:carboxylesterase 1-like n=1 Tax=Euphorbia lathyris TaxID=212925 RepID=UPI0033134FC5
MPENQPKTSINSPKSDFRNLIISNPDGTYTRHIQFPSISPNPNSSSSPILTKDIPINTSNQTYLRIYLPRHLLTTTTNHRLPLLIYFHGGGFVFSTPSSTINHDFCYLLSQHINAVIVSVRYRLAPEHRLPAAYDDAIEALQFIKMSDEHWLTQFTDVSRCFLMGTSAGGNIGFHVVSRSFKLDLEPLKIRGLILHHPFFGGLERTQSEIKMAFDSILPLAGNDFLWELSLPEGSDRDHEFCNPVTGFDLEKFEGVRVLVLGCYGDPLFDRHVELVKMFEEKGVKIVKHFGEGLHGWEVNDLRKAELIFPVLNDFMSSCVI